MNLQRLFQLPVVRTAYRLRFNRQFEQRGIGTYRGVYGSFAEATKDAPPTKPLGYDHPGPASLYKERLHRLYPSDYPVILWLERLLAAGCRRVCDVGGHVGVAFHSFRRYLDFPPDLTWTVVDVPAVCDAGRKLAAELGFEKQLHFASDIAVADGHDVLFAAGSLQYVESPLWETLAAMKSPPATLLVNNLPVTQGEGFVTLQNIGIAYCPYLIFNERELLGGYAAKGYELHDCWSVPTHACILPLTPERSVNAYSGFAFASKASPLVRPSPLARLAEDARALGS